MDNPENPSDIADQFRILGDNLARALHAAWESPERKKLQDEIREGLTDMAVVLKGEVNSFRQSPTGQRLESDIDELRQRVESGEAADQVRNEVLDVLKLINAELEKTASRWSRDDSA